MARDVIVRVDGVPASTVDEMRSRVVGRPGTPVVVELLRGGAPVTLTITRAP
jgi:S1-C subfamily serine protease